MNTKARRAVRPLTDEEKKIVNEVLQKTPHLSDADIAHQMHEQGLATDLVIKDLRNKIRYARPKSKDRVRVQTHRDGSVTVLHNTNTPSPTSFLNEELLEEVNLDPSRYELSSYGESEWESANGDTLHSFRKKFVRKNDSELSAEDMFARTTLRKIREMCGTKAPAEINKIGAEEFVTNKYGSYYGKLPISAKNKDGKYSIVIPLTDLHIGEKDADKMVLSYKSTFVNSIIPQIAERYFDGRSGMVRTIDVVCMGDLIHCDNDGGKTTAGTEVHPGTDVYTSFDKCVDFIEWLLITLRETFRINVRLVYVYGNHDTNMGFGIIRVLNMAFRKVDGIDFIINEKLFSNDDEWFASAEKNPEYMWVQYGNMGITYTHGKFIKKNIGQIPEVANPNARKQVDYNAVIYGHLHHLAEGTSSPNQHNFGLSTPNFTKDKFAKMLGCVTDPEFYLFEVNHQTNRVGYTQFPSLPYHRQQKL